jgi:hypothetical protein
MLSDCFNGCVRARSLGIGALIKKKGEPLLLFTGLWFDICAIIFWLPLKKIQDYVMEEEEFEDLED